MTTWAQHVGKFAKKNNMKLGQAMKNSKCKAEWKKIKISGGDAADSSSVKPADSSSDAAASLVKSDVADSSYVKPAAASPIPGGRRRKSSKKTKKNRRSKKSRKNYR